MASRIEAPPDFGGRIRRLRGRLGLTQVRLAELMGVSFASINRWENGQSRPSALAWQKIRRAEELGINGLSQDAGGTVPGASEGREGEIPGASSKTCPPDMDFSADPEAVRVVVEAYRLGYGHLFNPTFATETSLIDPLPHQHIAVYQHMVPQPRLRFLLADDAGAGKTIMTGLYVREMLARGAIRRVLVVPPAGLVGNWLREMRSLFSLGFRIVTGADARSANPFIGPDSNLIIISVDTLAGERVFSRLQEPEVIPYDLVVFDEAHKLSANRDPDFTIHKTDRYCLAEALAGVPGTEERWALEWSCRHVLLLTATPHMGHDYPYYALWRLLEPEVLSTPDAFNAFPEDERRRRFIRRAKEEMVRLDGTPIYPTRISDTLSYDLSQGEISEQMLYDRMTDYMRTYYNLARTLNRSAVRLATSVFQRRLASSTYALLRSLRKKLDYLNAIIDDLRTGKATIEGITAIRGDLLEGYDVLEGKTPDEEEAQDGLEENELAEDRALASVSALRLADLETERQQVENLIRLAENVYSTGEESKFEKLREVIRDPRFAEEKMIIFTEYRDTLEFLVRRLDALGFTGKVAQIHGGMGYQERDEQVGFFRKPVANGGASYLVATDAAGEGINLQFCRLMVNYDIPWNPARLEQRMGRIHRYGQKYDPVHIINLVAGETREGKVLKVLLDKLEHIRRELGSDKVFDVIGRLFEGVSLREYMERVVTSSDQGIEREIEGRLTKEQVRALEERQRRLFGEGGDILQELPRLREAINHEVYGRLLPGYVRGFIEKAAPLAGIGIDGDLSGTFAFYPAKPAAMDPLLPVLEEYPPEMRDRLTIYRPEDGQLSMFLRPGEPLFDRFREHVCWLFGGRALAGAVFVDPVSTRPYGFHLAFVEVKRLRDDNCPAFVRDETMEIRLVGLKQYESGDIEECPVEHLLLLRGGRNIPPEAVPLALKMRKSLEAVEAFLTERVARSLAATWRERLSGDLAEREEFLRKGFDYQDADLAAARVRLSEKVRAGDASARRDLERVKARQRLLAQQRDIALAMMRREPEMISPGTVAFLAHALVVPSSDPEDVRRYDKSVEAVAVKVARAYEEANGAIVSDVSAPDLARAAGLIERPGFDLLSRYGSGEERAIEVKGRALTGDIELSENEWAKACNLRERYWLYVVFDCGTPHPRLFRIRDPWGELFVRRKGGVIVDETAICEAAERGDP
ncbi:MAG: helicase-related protein [Ignavibacteriales bacterium]